MTLMDKTEAEIRRLKEAVSILEDAYEQDNKGDVFSEYPEVVQAVENLKPMLREYLGMK